MLGLHESGPAARQPAFMHHHGSLEGLSLLEVPCPPHVPLLLSCVMAAFSASCRLYRTMVALCLRTCSRDRTIKLWGRLSKPLRTFSGHTADVLCLSNRLLDDPPSAASLSPFATGSLDGTVRVWSLAPPGKGRSPLLATLIGHVAAVSQLAVPRLAPDC